jgi:heptaprenyl diphosphate synthase
MGKRMKLHEALHIDLGMIDEALKQVVLTDPDMEQPSVISDSILSLIASGGKRLRPIMVIVGSRFGVAPTSLQDDSALSSPIIRIAAILEYLHMASLVHDDIIDHSDLRRNEPTLHKLTNVYTATHIANYMMSRAIEWASMSNDDRISRIVGESSLLTQLCIGEYQQLYNQFNFNTTLDNYLEKTRNKTALLMANCLRSGAEIAGADEHTCPLLFEFGECLGMAFQIHDDLLDYTHTSDTIGKPVGSDLRNGNVTLPVLFALEDPELSPHIRSLSAASTADEVQRVVDLIVNSDCLARAEQLGSTYIQRANKIIDILERSPAHRDLRILLDYFD